MCLIKKLDIFVKLDLKKNLFIHLHLLFDTDITGTGNTILAFITGVKWEKGGQRSYRDAYRFRRSILADTFTRSSCEVLVFSKKATSHDIPRGPPSSPMRYIYYPFMWIRMGIKDVYPKFRVSAEKIWLFLLKYEMKLSLSW